MDNNLLIKKAFSLKVTKVLGSFLLVVIIGSFLFSAPISQPNKNFGVHVSSKDTLNSLAEELKEEKIIKSKFFLKSFVFLFNLNTTIDKGDYLFKKDSPVFTIAWQIAKGKHKVGKIKITLREGLTNEEISDILVSKLTNFNKDIFIEKSYGKEGYLFPDTYFFFPMDTAEEVVEQLSDNFINQTKKFDLLIKKSKSSKKDIITMASIIEKEAKGEKDARLISGILWKRLEIDMPLQVDASPITYKEIGLPPTPISNPGLLSIEASLNPIDSSYLYYLHDKNGEVHFAKSYEEHKSNINKFLR